MATVQPFVALQEPRVSPAAAPPRRRTDRETTPGRCGNLDYCSLGMQRALVQVPVSKAFVCPECARPLRPPGSRADGRPTILPVLRLVVLGGAVVASLATGYLVGRVKPAVDKAVTVAEQEVGLTPGQRSTPAGKQAGAEQSAAVSLAPSIEVTGRPYPARAAAAGAAIQAPKLGREARAGQVTVDCLLTQAQRHPACRVADVRGTDAVSAASLAWLQGLSVHYTPDGAGKAGSDHRWRVTFEDFSGAAKTGAR